jgi:hypothetical protein
MIDPQVVQKMIEVLEAGFVEIIPDGGGDFRDTNNRRLPRFSAHVKYITWHGLIKAGLQLLYNRYDSSGHIQIYEAIHDALIHMAGVDFWLDESERLTNDNVLDILRHIKEKRSTIYD